MATPRIEFDEWVDVEGHWTQVRALELPSVRTEAEAYALLLMAIGDLECRVRLAALRAGIDRPELDRLEDEISTRKVV